MSLEDKLYPFLSVYDRLPHGIKWSLGFAYRQLPIAIRRGENYRKFKVLAQDGESWDTNQIEEYQFHQLRQTLREAQEYCPYYRRKFAEAGFSADKLQSAADLENCPLLEKRDLLEHRDEMVSKGVARSARLYITTGGSTGIPVGFYLEKGVSRPKEQAFLETMWKKGGYFDGARMAMLRGYVTSPKVNGQISSYDATRDWLLLSSYHLTPEKLPVYLERLERFKPDLLYTFASTALQFAEYLEKSGQIWRLPLRGVLCSSERLTLPQQKIIQRVFKCRVYTWYGHSERVVLAAWGRKTDIYYFVPQYGFTEFGPPNAEGLREVIGTSFHNRAMPLIRYRTGDYVRLLDNDSPAREYPWPAAVEIAGREQEFLISGTGRRISLATLNMHDDIFDELYAVQVFQDAPGKLEFRYVAGSNFESSRLQQIEKGIRRKLGDDFELTMRRVENVERTPTGKQQWLVNKVQ
jgi:phenylacetate-CoA ligase